MDRWLKLSDACMEFRLSARGVLNLVRSGQLVSVRLSKRGRKTGALRILYPGPRIASLIQESERHLEHVPLLSGREVAEALSVKPSTIRQLKRRGHIRGTRVGNSTLFTAVEVRRFLFERERRTRDGRTRYSPILVRWLIGRLDQDTGVNVQVLDSLLRAAVALPEPIKSQFISEIWEHFDRINEMLSSAKTGKDIPPRRKSTPFVTNAPPSQVNHAKEAIRSLQGVRLGRAHTAD